MKLPKRPIPGLSKLTDTIARLHEFRAFLDDLIEMAEYLQELYPLQVAKEMQLLSVRETAALVTG